MTLIRGFIQAEQHRNDLKRLYALTQKIHSLHIPSQAPMALNITSNERASIERAIRSFTKIDDPYKVARDAAFQALYHDAWPRFLQWRLQLLHNKSQRCNSVSIISLNNVNLPELTSSRLPVAKPNLLYPGRSQPRQGSASATSIRWFP